MSIFGVSKSAKFSKIQQNWGQIKAKFSKIEAKLRPNSAKIEAKFSKIGPNSAKLGHSEATVGPQWGYSGDTVVVGCPDPYHGVGALIDRHPYPTTRVHPPLPGTTLNTGTATLTVLHRFTRLLLDTVKNRKYHFVENHHFSLSQKPICQKCTFRLKCLPNPHNFSEKPHF